jgi:hypothetical protein
MSNLNGVVCPLYFLPSEEDNHYRCLENRMDKFNVDQDSKFYMSNLNGVVHFHFGSLAMLTSIPAARTTTLSFSFGLPNRSLCHTSPAHPHLFSLISLSHASPTQQIFILVKFLKSRPYDLNSLWAYKKIGQITIYTL